MEFTREGASIAQELIKECLEQAKKGLIESLQDKNRKRFDFWMPRLIHIWEEEEWIIKKIQAVADKEAGRPPKE